MANSRKNKEKNQKEMKKEKKLIRCILPERLTNPYYGSAELEQNLRKMAKKAPGIHKIWEMTKDLPSLTELIIEEREGKMVIETMLAKMNYSGYCPICGSTEIDTSGYCWRHRMRVYTFPDNSKKRLKGLFRGLRVEEENIEEAKKSLFPEREF